MCKISGNLRDGHVTVYVSRCYQCSLCIVALFFLFQLDLSNVVSWRNWYHRCINNDVYLRNPI